MASRDTDNETTGNPASQRGRLIAFCGIDGAGKTSLIARLEQDGAIPGAVYLRKERKNSINLVVEYGLSDESGGQSWAEGAFAENAATATAFDFLHHYQENIAPRLAAGELLVCDRYAFCYEAYIHAVGSEFRFPGIFERLRRPDLLIYVDAPVEVVIRRFQLRGGATEDEQPEVMRRYRAAYLALLPEQEKTTDTFVVENTGTFEETYAVIKGRINDFLSSRS